jgi:HAD superfamily hydrolase (TIGR01509 family)
MTKPYAIIFDMDGVIVDSNPYHKIALRQFASMHGQELTEEQLREKIYGRTNKEWLINLLGPLTPELIHRYTEEKEEIYRKLIKNEIQPVAGLISFLEKLEEYGIPKAIGTSAPPSNVTFTLEGTGTSRFFKTILDETSITHGKPHPEIYLKVAAALGLPNGQCIVIEDSISGIHSGKLAGSRVVGITTTHPASEMTEADYFIDDFQNLDPRELIERVMKAN